VTQGQLFIALKGDDFDGHDFIEKAVENGAAGLVVSQHVNEEATQQLPVFHVEDTLEALGDLARYRRKRIGAISHPVVVGITGSCGKTTVKEMVASIFMRQWPDSPSAPEGRVLKTKGNFNNLIGLPLSLLPLQLKHRAAIMEMGMNVPGEIGRLATIADPDISCIVNIHGAHLEGLGSIEGVARAKEELFQNTKSSGILVVNSDDQNVEAAAQKYPHKKIRFSTVPNDQKNVRVWAENIGFEDNGNVHFHLHIDEKWRKIILQVPGKHNVANCLAAASLAHAANIDIDVIAAGLQEFQASEKRLEVITTEHGYSLINDTYNANPGSMAAGLDTLTSMLGGQKIAILGDMLELGGESENAHIRLGMKAAECELNYLVVIGEFAEYIARGAEQAGLNKERISVFKDKNESVALFEKLRKEGHIAQGDWILVKASRGLRLETVVEALL